MDDSTESTDNRPTNRGNRPTLHGDCMTYKKKLIEVALPLDAINKASVREKNNPFVREHPRNLHLYSNSLVLMLAACH